MKLIIDISEETYNALIGDEWIDGEYIDNMINSIQNGTPPEEELEKIKTKEAIEALYKIIKDERLGYGTYFPLEVLKTSKKESLKIIFINKLKDLQEKTENYLGTINDVLDWFEENKE